MSSSFSGSRLVEIMITLSPFFFFHNSAKSILYFIFLLCQISQNLLSTDRHTILLLDKFFPIVLPEQPLPTPCSEVSRYDPGLETRPTNRSYSFVTSGTDWFLVYPEVVFRSRIIQSRSNYILRHTEDSSWFFPLFFTQINIFREF